MVGVFLISISLVIIYLFLFTIFESQILNACASSSWCAPTSYLNSPPYIPTGVPVSTASNTLFLRSFVFLSLLKSLFPFFPFVLLYDLQICIVLLFQSSCSQLQQTICFKAAVIPWLATPSPAVSSLAFKVGAARLMGVPVPLDQVG